MCYYTDSSDFVLLPIPVFTNGTRIELSITDDEMVLEYGDSVELMFLATTTPVTHSAGEYIRYSAAVVNITDNDSKLSS